jgi:hypothetical protein
METLQLKVCSTELQVQEGRLQWPSGSNWGFECCKWGMCTHGGFYVQLPDGCAKG